MAHETPDDETPDELLTAPGDVLPLELVLSPARHSPATHWALGPSASRHAPSDSQATVPAPKRMLKQPEAAAAQATNAIPRQRLELMSGT
jgi:hypothetical protein